ncbi:MAG: M6 family metalloprotease domain-containing protein [Bacteroidales bacterium]|nr:M6 family metalloprotease domain-containing protein [Bacteroidales bacterium]
MKKKIRFWLFALFMIGCFSVQAAYFSFVPRILKQPDGEQVHCFASGDEFYNWLHDAEGYTIIQNTHTGYFVYATLEKGQLVPTAWLPGHDNPASKGNLRPWLKISEKEYLQRRESMLAPARRPRVRDENTNKGHMNNIAIFIRFADDTNFTNSFESVEQMFNDSIEPYNSMYTYFRQASYNQLFIKTSFFPQPSGDLILSYQDSLTRDYYVPWSETDTNGYQTDSARRSREFSLLARATAYVENMIPADLDLDYNDDGFVDNVCFIVRGDVGDWNVLLWPHRWSLYGEEAYIHGKRVWDFNFQLADAGYYFANSTLCHEMFHTLGAPDLYHYSDSTNQDPVGQWDLMCSNTHPYPQQMLIYMKAKYGNWVSYDDIPVLSQYGRYSVRANGSDIIDQLAYRVPTQSPFEYIIVEYRNKKMLYDPTPQGGLIFYRVNPLWDGNANYNGDDVQDEVYVFRRGTNSSAANFNQIHNNFNPTTNPYPFLSDSSVVNVSFGNFSSYIPSNPPAFMEFDYLEYVGIEDYEQNISLYPNPTTNMLTITTDMPSEKDIQVVDLFGRVLLEQKSEDLQIKMDISRLSSGCYLLRISAPNRQDVVTKFIKQ